MGTQQQVISIKISCWLLLQPLDLGALQIRFDCPDNALSDAVLQREDVIRLTFEAVCPNVCARVGPKADITRKPFTCPLSAMDICSVSLASRTHFSNALTLAFISIGWLRTEDQEGEC
jgi:hypothetical protein